MRIPRSPALVALLLLHALSAPSRAASAESSLAAATAPPDSAVEDSLPPQKDISDLIGALLGRKSVAAETELNLRPGLSIIALPSVGYNPALGGYVGVGASAGGWLGEPAITKVSV